MINKVMIYLFVITQNMGHRYFIIKSSTDFTFQWEHKKGLITLHGICLFELSYE